MLQQKHLDQDRISAAMQAVPRAQFIEMDDASLVMGRSIPPANAVEQILTLANVQADQNVLQLGTGAGYVAAVLARLAGHVITVEKNPAIARLARRRFQQLDLPNINLITGDGSHGVAKLAPFDRILVSSPRITDKTPLLEQLTPDGMLLALEASTHNSYIIARYSRDSAHVMQRSELAVVDFSHDSGMTLLDMGMIDPALLSEARRTARQKRVPVIRVLREKLNMEDTTLYRSLAEENGMPFAALEDILPDVQPQLMERFSRSFLDGHHLIPLKLVDQCLHVVTDDPDTAVDDILNMHAFEDVVKVLVTPNDFRRLWTTVELSLQSDEKQLWAAQVNSEKTTAPPANDAPSPQTRIEAHLITLLDALLMDAVSEGASDLHIEQYKERTRLRLRVDGDLHDLSHYKLSPREARGLVNVIKIRGDMDIAEKRLPQGGRSQLTAGGVGYDLRIQVQPSLHGEAVVIRMLPQSGNIVAIEDLGMGQGVMRQYRRLLDNPSGLVLVVGPTGSGKSTTLYAGLSELAKDGRRKVITIEDPIEYSMEGIQQTRTRPDIGFNFADGMRSFVRLDPDVILVGEIRDQETAVEAIRASQTGHVVLSTLHSNDAVDALQRIYDLNVHANSVASELMAVIAQKLAKRICPECREEAIADAAILDELFPEGTPDSFRCFRGAGCEHCNGRGTRGRVAVVEFMLVNDELRNAIALKLPVARLRSVALDSGLTTMRDSALNHVIEGMIPLEELPRILPADRMAPEKRGAN
tara:strand:+ start:103462 stop:105729 length:2268 start_codon:yes stop_codon:yes gene_type:complete